MEKLYFKKMVEDYNSIRFFSEEAYQLVFQKLIFRKLPKNAILKRKDEPDDRSRYICEGLVGLFDETSGRNKLVFLFGPTDTVFDEEGFRTQKSTSNSIRTMTETVLFEFSIEAEKALLAQNPQFGLLALEVAHRITRRTFEQVEIKLQGFSKGYPKLLSKFPGLAEGLKNKELADYFLTSTRTVERQKKTALEQKLRNAT